MRRPQDEITAQMQIYFDGLYHSDTRRLRQVFHPAARYVCATGDTIVNIGMDEYFPMVDAREPPAARNEPRRDAIVAITLAGDRTAFVHARCSIAERRFTDFLTFIRVPAGWRIIAKVFHVDIIPITP